MRRAARAAAAAAALLRAAPAEAGQKATPLLERGAPSAGEDPRLAFDGEPKWLPKTVGKVRRLRFGDGRRVSAKKLSDRPRLFRISGLLSDEEVRAVLQAGEEWGFEHATVTDPDGSKRSDEMRTSSSAFVEGDARADPLVLSVLRLAADLTGIPRAWVQDVATLQVLRYAAGEYYAVHYDSKPLSYYAGCEAAWAAGEQAAGWGAGGREQWQGAAEDCPRYVTLYLYLNDVPEGGETCFPLADDRWHRQLPHQQIFDLSMGPEFVSNYSMRCIGRPPREGVLLAAPRRGDALLWYNHVPGEPGSGNGLGERDGLAAHMAMMPDGAVKYGANLWLNAPWWGATPGRRERRRRRRRSSSPRGGGDL